MLANKRAFSLVEALISLGLISGIILAGAYFMLSSEKSKLSLKSQVELTSRFSVIGQLLADKVECSNLLHNKTPFAAGSPVLQSNTTYPWIPSEPANLQNLGGVLRVGDTFGGNLSIESILISRLISPLKASAPYCVLAEVQVTAKNNKGTGAAKIIKTFVTRISIDPPNTPQGMATILGCGCGLDAAPVVPPVGGGTPCAGAPPTYITCTAQSQVWYLTEADYQNRVNSCGVQQSFDCTDGGGFQCQDNSNPLMGVGQLGTTQAQCCSGVWMEPGSCAP